MKRILLAGVLALGCAGVASAQGDPQHAWNLLPPTSTQALAWAMTSVPETGFPTMVVLGRGEQPGGARVRASAVTTMQVDCPGTKVRILEQTAYDGAFKQKAHKTDALPWAPMAVIGPAMGAVTAWCTTLQKSTPEAKTMTVDAAQVWLDGLLPKPKVVPVPPATSNFELVGTLSDMQHVDLWLDVDSIKRDGATATAWAFDAWQGGWEKMPNGRTAMDRPATWRLYAFNCGAILKSANTWYQQYDPKLAPVNTRELDDKPSITLGILDQVMEKRVCNNRPMTFSAKFSGSAAELIASRYGAGSYVSAKPKPLPRQKIEQADLGPVLQIRHQDGDKVYTGTYKPEYPGATYYKGEIDYGGNYPKIADTITVMGLVDGELILVDSYRKGRYAFPITNGQPGKGIMEWERHRDNAYATLLQPTTVTPKAAPVPPKAAPTPPAPAPVAVFQLPNVVKFREVSTKPGAGVYEATWTRRGTSNLYDGAWIYLPTGQKFADVMEVRGVVDGRFTVYRQGIKGTYSFPMVDGKPGRGTATWVSDPAFYVEFLLN